MTYEIASRTEFAKHLRSYRAARAIRSYGRLEAFGRAIITVDGARIVYTAWTACPPMNIWR